MVVKGYGACQVGDLASDLASRAIEIGRLFKTKNMEILDGVKIGRGHKKARLCRACGINAAVPKSSMCNECKNEKSHSYYHLVYKLRPKTKEHSDRVIAASKDRYRRQRAIIDEAKDRPCADCGVKYIPPVMEFDHVRGTKVRDVPAMASFAKGKLIEEIAKCDVVCANCHRIRTYSRGGTWARQS